MTVGALTSRDAVIAAIEEFDHLGRSAFLEKYGFGGSQRHVLVHDGKEYDSKAIVGAAHGFEHPESGPLRSEDFAGGLASSVRKLEDLGFEVRSTGTPAPSEIDTGPSWIFQANPRFYDIAGAIRNLDEMNWSVAQGKRLMHAGQRVYLWQSGKGGGVVAVGTILTEPEVLPFQEGPEFIVDQEKFAGEELRVRLSIDQVLDEPIDREWLKEHPTLSGLSILRFANATNFNITPEQDEALQRVIAGDAEPQTGARVWWVNQSQTYNEERAGGYLWAPRRNRAGGSVAHWDALASVAQGDLVLSYAGSELRAVSRVEEAAIDAPRPGEDGFQAWDEDGRQVRVAYRDLESGIPLAAIPEQWRIDEGGPFNRFGGVNQGYLFPLSDEFAERLNARFPELQLGGKTVRVPEPLTVDALKATAAEEQFALRLEEELYSSLVAALQSGKHVVLTGPPGTAKTTLAQAVSETAKRAGLCDGYLLTTATADWTTYETIGGLRPSGPDRLEFSPGHFLEAIEANQWLVIDELNRSQFDRAFGQLFTVLSGQPVTLPYSRPGAESPLTLLPAGTEPPTRGADVLEIPPNWRIVATMNVFDKSLLFEMSYALMRRFAFIEVPSPSDDAFRDLIDSWAENEDGAEVAKAWLPLRDIKDLGPAVYRDIAAYASRRLVMGGADPGVVRLEAFYSYLLPQFEGLDEASGRALYGRVAEITGASRKPEIYRMLTEVLGLAGLKKPGAAGETESSLGAEEMLDEDT